MKQMSLQVLCISFFFFPSNKRPKTDVWMSSQIPWTYFESLAFADAVTAVCSDENINRNASNCLTSPSNPAQTDNTTRLNVTSMSRFLSQCWTQTAEMTRGAACHQTSAHSVGLGPGCGPFQRRVRATYLRSPPFWKKVTSISVSNSAVTEKDFPALVWKRTQKHKSFTMLLSKVWQVSP